MNDLLSSSFSSEKGRSFSSLELEMAVAETNENLALFFSEVAVIKSEREKIKRILIRLNHANEESKTVHKAQAMKDLRARMVQDVQQVLKKAKAIKEKLEQLETANLESRKIPGCEERTSTDRTRMGTTNGLKISLKILMAEFERLRKNIMTEYKETIGRRYFTVTGQNAEEETIESIVEKGESENMFQIAIQEQGRGEAVEVIRDIEERHDAIKDIEKNLLELHQLFLEMSVLVDSQGELLNDIEIQVKRASSCIQKGRKELRHARNFQKKSRKWTCVAIIILIIIFVIIFLPLLIRNVLK